MSGAPVGRVVHKIRRMSGALMFDIYFGTHV